MNLIEQLGGYERAKDGLHRLKLEKKDLLACGDLVVVESEIDAALLEYRRQHNIFEVGDPIIDACIGNSVIKYHGGYDNHENWVSCFVRHATDEEIKAGKRLEVNQ